MTAPRFALGLIRPDGSRWFAVRDPSKGGPMRTADPLLAHTWESPAAVAEWLASIPGPEVVRGQAISSRDWMEGLKLVAVPLTGQVGEPVPLTLAKTSKETLG
jgi:hypothetical protein